MREDMRVTAEHALKWLRVCEFSIAVGGTSNV
jgi:hypothetical protein